MSSNNPPSSKPGDDEHGLYYLSTVGQETQMTRAHDSPQQPPTLPVPLPLTGERRQLPPLPSLQSPARPATFQSQFPGTSLPERPHLPYARPSSVTRPATESVVRSPDPSQQASSGPVSSLPHPHLYAQKASYQSRNPGTVYEALSPVEYNTGGPASLFNEAAYSQIPFAPGPISYQSPTISHHSSSSSAAGSGHVPAQYRPGSSAMPPPSTGPLGAPNDMLDRYVLRIRQQPVAARACGFGERDRRVIDPPPIVQLSLKNYDPRSPADVAELHFPFNIVQCTLLSASPNQAQDPTSAPISQTPLSSDVTAVQDPNQNNRLSRRLMGTLCATSFVGTDPEAPSSSVENANLSAFFIFQDLSCRQNGLYRLRFTLMKVPIGPNVVEGELGSLCGNVESDVFEVFSAKDFPGMRASTALTRDLKRQGAPVSVKKGKDPSAAGGMGKEKRGETSDSGSDEEGEREVRAKGRPRKKRA